MKKIAIHSVPRSGSTWLGCIFDSSPVVSYRYQPLFSYTFKDYLSNSSKIDEINNFFDEIRTSEDSFINQNEAKEKGIIPKFEKSADMSFSVYKEVRYHHILRNLLEKDKEIKIIGLVRNPLEVLNSWFKAPREFRKDLEWEKEIEWRHAQSKNQGKVEEFYGFEKWKEVANMFLGFKKEFPSSFYLLEYEDLKENTVEVVKELFEFCDIPLGDSTLEFIGKSKTTDKIDTYSVFKSHSKGEINLEELEGYMIEEIKDELKDSSLEKFIRRTY